MVGVSLAWLAIALAGAVEGDGSPPSDPAPAASPIAISWNVPEGCPGKAALEADILRIAGQAAPPAEQLAAEATVRRGPGASWTLTLRTRVGDRTGERVLTAPECGELMHAAALVMALMINPQAGTVAESPPPAPPPPPPPPAPAEEIERRFAAGADVLVGSGALPGAAPGLGLRFAAARGGLSAELRASVSMSRRAASGADADAGGTFDLLDGALVGCARARRMRRFSPGACVGAAVVRVHGAGYGVSDPGAASAWWAAGLAEGNVRLRLSPRNAVRLAAQVLVPPGNPRFALAGVGVVFEPAQVWLRATLGWEIHF